jgi:hypothetical protein
VQDVVARATRTAAIPHVHPELGRQQNSIAPSLENLSKELLAAARAVDVRGVYEVDALLERGIDNRSRGSQIDAPAEIVGSEADHGDLELAVAEPAPG